MHGYSQKFYLISISPKNRYFIQVHVNRVVHKWLVLMFGTGHQWRSEGGGQGGHLPPGAARRGAPKTGQRIF